MVPNIETCPQQILEFLPLYRGCFLGDAGFSLRPTVAYSGSPEFAVHATRSIETGELISHLGGLIVPLQHNEEIENHNIKRSMILLRQGKVTAYFGGAASCVNHQCDQPAAKLMATDVLIAGYKFVHIRAIRRISKDEEITINYGPCYFGPSNHQCLCFSCEVKAQNGWTGGTRPLERTRARQAHWQQTYISSRIFTTKVVQVDVHRRIPGDYHIKTESVPHMRCKVRECKASETLSIDDGKCTSCRERSILKSNMDKIEK